MNFFDSFTCPQNPNSEKDFLLGSWGPSSVRCLNNGQLSGSGTLRGSETLHLTYKFPQPLDLTSLKSILFEQCTASPAAETVFTFYIDCGEESSKSASLSSQASSVSLPLPNNCHCVSTLQIMVTAPSSLSVSSFSSTSLCVGHNSRIATKDGEIAVQYLKRGQEILTLSGEYQPLARLIRQELDSSREVEFILFSPSSLGPGLPREATYCCSQHYLIYGGKRRMAQSFLPFPGVHLLRGPACQILPLAEDGKYYMYDLQFQVESSYWVNGLLSQSRSPYSSVSPLAKELYFQAEKYQEIRVANTWSEDPPISFYYLFPNGEERLEFAKVTLRK